MIDIKWICWTWGAGGSGARSLIQIIAAVQRGQLSKTSTTVRAGRSEALFPK